MRPALVRTFLTAPTTRDFTDRPRVDLGAVRFGGWQIHPVPSSAYAEDAYLIRVSLDLVTDDKADRPPWIEAGFEFETPDVWVLDTVPKSSEEPEPAGVYELSAMLNFVPAGHGSVPLAAQDPVRVSGLHGPDPAWRWSRAGGVTPGHREVWMVLLVPPAVREVHVRPRAAFGPPPGSDLFPVWEPVDRFVDLPRSRTVFPGEAALAFRRRLGDSWRDLATLVDVPSYDLARFTTGDEAGHLWRWLECRNELPYLADALDKIGRPDLAGVVRG
ncbi:hypothetical protein KOI35_32420 [Actinoplanes bogorensis]|uniref:Bacterial Death-like domain-containing protein n=1 Tax=Paractinoplanes bogorensis TaxID=1610840 RepID=A0ABS5YXR7_9ACTN|nr:hypothetical protein [Actinoplanes bogorensis]MBU2668227.1 hypothetical protein [Actinoplanes bogorensis]